MITMKNLLNHEMIGLEIEVVGRGIKGVIVDETKNTFVVRSNNRDKVIPKMGNSFIVDERFMFEGSLITQRPYERVRKVYKVMNKWQRTLVSKV